MNFYLYKSIDGSVPNTSNFVKLINIILV